MRVLIGLAISAWGLVLAVGSRDIPNTRLAQGIGPRAFPLFMGILLVVLGLLVVGEAVLQARRRPVVAPAGARLGEHDSAGVGEHDSAGVGEHDVAEQRSADDGEQGDHGAVARRRVPSLALHILLLLAYPVALPRAGYILTTAVYLVLAMSLSRMSNLLIRCAVAAGWAFASYWLFTNLLEIRLPRLNF